MKRGNNNLASKYAELDDLNTPINKDSFNPPLRC